MKLDQDSGCGSIKNELKSTGWNFMSTLIILVFTSRNKSDGFKNGINAETNGNVFMKLVSDGLGP